MSTTIGIGVGVLPAGGAEQLCKLVDSHGYGVGVGVEAAERDTLSGLRHAAICLGWSTVLLLRSPRTAPVCTALDIEEELRGAVYQGDVPPLFDLLDSMSDMLREHVRTYHVFFAGEWIQDESPRYIRGSTNNVKNILGQAGAWPMQLYNLKNRYPMDSDMLPLLVEIDA